MVLETEHHLEDEATPAPWSWCRRRVGSPFDGGHSEADAAGPSGGPGAPRRKDSRAFPGRRALTVLGTVQSPASPGLQLLLTRRVRTFCRSVLRFLDLSPSLAGLSMNTSPGSWLLAPGVQLCRLPLCADRPEPLIGLPSVPPPLCPAPTSPPCRRRYPTVLAWNRALPALLRLLPAASRRQWQLAPGGQVWVSRHLPWSLAPGSSSRDVGWAHKKVEGAHLFPSAQPRLQPRCWTAPGSEAPRGPREVPHLVLGECLLEDARVSLVC